MMSRIDVIGQNGNDGEHYSYIGDILNQREKTHGNFEDVAKTNMELVSSINTQLQLMIPTDFVAISMILHKISRIVSGNPLFNDHWDDIAGYARLALEFREKNEPECESIVSIYDALYFNQISFALSDSSVSEASRIIARGIIDICKLYCSNCSVCDIYNEIINVATNFYKTHCTK